MHLCCCYRAPPQLGKKVRFLGTDAAAPLTFSWPWCGCCTLTPSSLLHLLEPKAARVLHLQALSLSFVLSCLPTLPFQYAHLQMYQCVDLSGTLMCCAEESMRIIDVLLIVYLWGDTKGFSHFTVMLTSLRDIHIFQNLYFRLSGKC